ncbi:hypothetical protein GCM10007939_00810 [Amylibacter marinus]|uniref:Flp pilus assembly protein, pilin Flp n=1 Tax=Amylibacter marinus TaxID=1475483 RepID=A0ABQ5VRG6_9RHOB|nr:hypothetical protein [Amylibacter marinus]GLQ33798.1 hypothetical protein GCM10007939_00810 [Amylibacter marinus]
MKLFKKFRQDEAGAVTVDWVVLTAGVVILAGIAVGAVRDGIGSITSKISSAIDNPISS